MLTVEGVSAAYGERVVLEKVSFAVQRGEIFFIAGNSGGGKSTLLRQMIGLQPIAGGRITLLGHRVEVGMTEDRAVARLFGVAFQGGGAVWGADDSGERDAAAGAVFRREPERAVEAAAAAIGSHGASSQGVA